MKILILLPNLKSNSFKPQEIIKRQDLYGSAIKQYSGAQIQITAFYSGCSDSLTSEVVDLVCLSHKRTSILKFSFKAIKKIARAGYSPDSIIAGTPFQPLLIALILKCFNSSAKLHTSIHGDLNALLNSGMKNWIKLLFLRASLNRCASVRFVSDLQAGTASELINFTSPYLFTTPVPMPNFAASKVSREGKLIAFVGRLQKERGVQEWIDLGSRFSQEELIVVGDGPLRDEFHSKLPSAQFTGALSQEFVQDQWDRIGVLLSTAPFESYGLSMREALLFGVPVVSRKNLGSLELHVNYPKLVQVYETLDEAELQIRNFLANRPPKHSFSEFKNDFFESQNLSLKRLASAWTNAL